MVSVLCIALHGLVLKAELSSLQSELRSSYLSLAPLLAHLRSVPFLFLYVPCTCLAHLRSVPVLFLYAPCTCLAHPRSVPCTPTRPNVPSCQLVPHHCMHQPTVPGTCTVPLICPQRTVLKLRSPEICKPALDCALLLNLDKMRGGNLELWRPPAKPR